MQSKQTRSILIDGPSWGFVAGTLINFLPSLLLSMFLPILIGSPPNLHAVLLAKIPLYAFSRDPFMAYIAYSMIIIFAATLLSAIAAWMLDAIAWGEKSWRACFMLDVVCIACPLVPGAWFVMMVSLPLNWPVVLAAAFMIPFALALIAGVVTWISPASFQAWLKVKTLLIRGALNQPIALLNGLDASYHGKVLMLAISNGHTDIVEHIIDDEHMFGSIDAGDVRGAFKQAIYVGGLAFVKKFVEKADVIKGSVSSDSFWLNLAIDHCGEDTAIVEFFINKGSHINVTSGYSPLQRAVIAGNVACARLLLSKNADPDYFNKGVPRAGLHSSADTPRQMLEGSSAKMQAVFSELAPTGHPIQKFAAPPTTDAATNGSGVALGAGASINADPPAEQIAAI